ncbi:MAG: ABC transporter ATP-binding protein, partial [Thermoguttaceae bacterium]
MAVPLLVIVLGLITELFIGRGNLVVDATQKEAIRSWAGEPDRVLSADRVLSGRVEYLGRGLLPWVYRNREQPMLGRWLMDRYAHWGAVRENLDCLILLVATGLALAAVESLALVVLYRSAQQAALSIATRLREAIHCQASRVGASEMLGQRGAGLKKLFDESADDVTTGLVAWYRSRPRSVVLLIVLALLALLVDVWLTLAASLFAALTWLFCNYLQAQARRHAQIHGDLARQEHGTLVERLRQVPLATGYSLDETSGKPFAVALSRYRESQLKIATSDAIVTPAIVLFVLSGTALLLLLVGINVLRDPPGLTVSGTIVLGTALICAYFPMARLLRSTGPIRQAEEAAAEIFAYLDREPSVSQGPKAQPLGPLREQLELVSVTLANHNGRRFLDGASLTIPAGSRTAILASDSGAPMALAGLLLRLYDPAAGRILVDGKNLRDVTFDSLHRQTVLITGDGMLLTGTVSDNISCGDPKVSQIQVAQAAKQVGTYEFIQELPQGFSTVVGAQAP